MKSVFQLVEIWDALRAAAEADLSLAQAIVDSAGVIVQSADLTICYDERGAYSILHFLFSNYLFHTNTPSFSLVVLQGMKLRKFFSPL